MSYKNPDILILASPVGIDAVIQSIQQDLYSGLTWLEKSFGRAWELKEVDPDGRQIKVPKCYMGEAEYHNVLPNDFLKSQSFIAVRGEELTPDYTKFGMQSHTRQLSLIVWVNLKEIDSSNDTIFTELLKSDVEKVLARNTWVTSVERYYDERVEDVFDGYISAAEAGKYSVDDTKTQYLMYPYAGFRFDFTVMYPENVECSTWNTWPIPDHNPGGGGSGGGEGTESIPDLYFVVGDSGYNINGTNTLSLPQSIGKKVRVFRGGIIQTPYDNRGFYWSHSSTTGIVSVNPVWLTGEDVHIQFF